MVVEDEEREAGALPSSTALGAGNGGEYRKSFHGYAPGYGQVIESPQSLQLTPMQIDTWNRDKMDLVSGPLGVLDPGSLSRAWIDRRAMGPMGRPYAGPSDPGLSLDGERRSAASPSCRARCPAPPWRRRGRATAGCWSAR